MQTLFETLECRGTTSMGFGRECEEGEFEVPEAPALPLHHDRPDPRRPPGRARPWVISLGSDYFFQPALARAG